MARNTTTIVGYNNQLQEAVKDDPRFRLGKNDWLNKDTKNKPTGLQPMDGGPSKFQPAREDDQQRPGQAATTQQQQQKSGSTSAAQHEENKIVLIIGAIAIAGLAFFGFR